MEALSRWETTSLIAEICRARFGWQPSFTETIILYSKSDITRRAAKAWQAAGYLQLATDQYLQTGVQTYFLGLALWFEILGDWRERDGFPRIDKRQAEESMQQGS